MRSRLAAMGLWRESGHEHFNGCIVVPLYDDAGKVVSFYGRRVSRPAATRGELKHLYCPGPHRGLFKRQASMGEEVILCEAVRVNAKVTGTLIPVRRWHSVAVLRRTLTRMTRM